MAFFKSLISFLSLFYLNEEISSFIEIHEDKKDSFTNFLHEKTSGKVSVIK